MNTIKAIALGFFSVLTISGVNAQVTKVKKEIPKYYGDPKMKIKDLDGDAVIKDKGYGGYFRNRAHNYYYDVNRHQYYNVYNGRKVYYRKGWLPD
jgi:hypothetical protein